jgi:DNA-directed RNA polymerase I, II, and III subunit RPABC2
MSSYFDNEDGDGYEDYKKMGGSDNEDNDDKSNTSSIGPDYLDENIGDALIGGNDEEEEEDEEDEEDEEEEDEEDDEEDDEEEEDVIKGGAQDFEEREERLKQDHEDELEEAEGETESKSKRVKKIPAKTIYKKPEIDDDDEDEDEDDDGEMYLQKFDRSVNSNYVVDNHPESVLQNYDEILAMTKVIRDKHGIIIDDLHKTIPYLTKYERSRILGQRAKQINAGSPPFIKVPENVIDGYIIAEMELREKRIPFIIRRPLPNGGSEYWSIKDLEDITF